MSGRSRLPFTATQWQELEHQALIYKYMVSGMPIPPELLFSIKRSLDSPLSSKLFSHQPHPIGWNCFQMGLGRKVDLEPGRCRRTDGKKWRCSKEAFPDSKYCERHMHRGKNRSRKPVEVSETATIPSTPSISSITKTHSTLAPTSPISALSSMSYETNHHHHLYHPSYATHLHHPILYSHASSSRPPGTGLSPQENTTHLFLDSGSYSQPNTEYRNRYIYGLKEEVDEHAFFSEPSGTMRSFSSSSMDESWQLTPLTISSSSSKQRSCSGSQSDYSYLGFQTLTDTPKEHKQNQHCYVVGSNIKCDMPIKMERDEEPQKIHRFFDEWPPKNRDTWIDLDDKLSNSASVSTTRLSISTPNSSNDFPIFNSRIHNDG